MASKLQTESVWSHKGRGELVSRVRRWERLETVEGGKQPPAWPSDYDTGPECVCMPVCVWGAGVFSQGRGEIFMEKN